jgi:hypothetical protein
MKRIGAEIRFDNTFQTALTELNLLNKKPTKERIDGVKDLIK